MKKLFILVTALALNTAFGQLLQNDKFTAIKVGKTEFTKGKIDTSIQVMAMQQFRGQQVPPEAMSQLKFAVVQQLISMELVRQEAHSQKIKVNKSTVDSLYDQQMAMYRSQFPSEAEFKAYMKQQNVDESWIKKQVKDQVMSDQLLRKVVSEPSLPTEKEIKDFYTQSKALFPVNDTLSGFQIIQKTKKGENKQIIEDKKLFLNGLAAQVRMGKATFEQLAAQYSDDPQAKTTGGVMGRFTLKDVKPAFAKAIKNLNVGDISKAFNTPEGVHLFLLMEKNDGKFESYKIRIQAMLYQQKVQQAQMKFYEYLKTLESKYPVVYYDKSYQAPAMNANMPSPLMQGGR